MSHFIRTETFYNEAFIMLVHLIKCLYCVTKTLKIKNQLIWS